MEREQILKVMVPVGAFAVLLLVIGLVIAFAGGGGGAGAGTDKGGQPSPTGKFTQFALDGPEWKDLGHGLKVWDVKVGDGKECPAGAMVTAHYTGWRPDGFSFDSSRKHGTEPSEFSLHGVVAGWTEGIPGMKVGGVRRLYIPSAMGYGAPGRGKDIPPNTDLIFEVELAEVK